LFDTVDHPRFCFIDDGSQRIEELRVEGTEFLGLQQIGDVFSVTALIVRREHPAHAYAQSFCRQPSQQGVLDEIVDVADVLVLHCGAGLPRGICDLLDLRGIVDVYAGD
jgi:hypothetical protein